MGQSIKIEELPNSCRVHISSDGGSIEDGMEAIKQIEDLAKSGRKVEVYANVPPLAQIIMAGGQLYAEAEKVVTASQQIAKEKGIPEELRLKMVRYASELRRKYPNMKPARVQRKVAEHFKIKLV